MNRYLLIFFLLINLVSCSPWKNLKQSSDTIQPYPVIKFDDDLKLVYKASIDMYNKHFSGLFVFRQVPGHTTGYILFLSEVGLEFIRFKQNGTEVNLVQAAEAFRKKAIINTFKTFIETLIHETKKDNISILVNAEDKLSIVEKLPKNIYYYYYLSESNKVVKISRFKRNRLKYTIDIDYDKSTEFPKSINFAYNNIKLTIKLTLISNAE